MAYWYGYGRSKSIKNIDKEKVINESDYLVQFSVLERMGTKELKDQKSLYEDLQHLLNNIYSVEIFKKNLKELNSEIKKIENTLILHQKDLKSYLTNIKDKKIYYKEKKAFFPTKIAVSLLTLPESASKSIFKIEKKINETLKNKKLEECIDFFERINSHIHQHFHLFNITIFPSNKFSWDEQTKDSKVFFDPYGFLFNHKLTFDRYIQDKFDLLKSRDKVNFNVSETSFNKSYLKEILDLYDVYDDYLIDNKDTWPHQYVRFDDTSYTKEYEKESDAESLKEIKKSINSYGGSKDKFFYNEKLYKNYHKSINEIISKYLRKIELLIRAKLKKVKKEENVGYVYVLKSIGYPGMYKIGSTYGLPEERAEDLSGTNVPDPWTVTAKIKIKDAEYYEKQIHKILAEFRYRRGREFFKIDLSKIKDCLKQVSDVTEKGSLKLKFSQLQKKIDI